MAARIGMPGLSTYSATQGASARGRPSAARQESESTRVSPGPTRTDLVLLSMGEKGAAPVTGITLLKRLAAPAGSLK
jgi:hypothetical protein